MSLRLTLIGLLLFTLGSVGCEQKTVVTGKVTYNGQPVEKGAISFRPSGPGQSFGANIKDGAYEAPQAKPGSWMALIVGVREIDHSLSSGDAAKKAAENKTPDHLAGHVSQAADYIAPDAEGNSKQVEITAGSQTLDFDLKGPPK